MLTRQNDLGHCSTGRGWRTNLITSESIVVEIVQVLSSKVLYNQPRATVARHLSVIVALAKAKAGQ